MCVYMLPCSPSNSHHAKMSTWLYRSFPDKTRLNITNITFKFYFLPFVFSALSASLKGKTYCTTVSHTILTSFINYRLWTFHALIFRPFYIPADEESMTLFQKEDFHIMLPSTKLEVTFRNRSNPRSNEVPLMRGGNVINSRARINTYLTHLIIESVEEGDEGVYTIKNPDKPDDVKRIRLIVRGTEYSGALILKHSLSWYIRQNWYD